MHLTKSPPIQPCQVVIAMEAQSSSNSLKNKKPSRRRSHTRRSIAQASVINLAQARREIAHALLLHRFSFASSSTISPTTKAPVINPSTVAQERSGNSYTYTINPNLANAACYWVVEDMPLHVPEPIWSTTAPWLPAQAPPLPGSQALDFLQWGETQAAASSAYAWWLAFLEALDGNINNLQKAKSHFVDDNSISTVLTEPSNARPTTDQNASLDHEWLLHLIKEEDDS